MHKLTLAATIAAALALTGCHSEDEQTTESSPTIATGVFKDSNVSGLNFISGDQSGTTGTNGSFSYEVGNTVTFSIGSVTLGTAIGGSVVTPIDLITNGSIDSPQVENIIRFLLLLDSDLDWTNGIQISSAVRSLANNWPQVDFNNTDLPAELASIASQVASVHPGASLPDGPTASTHFETTLGCIYAGAYKGTFSGTDQGRVALRVNAPTTAFNREVNVITFSTIDSSITTLSGESSIDPAFFPVTANYSRAFASGRLASGSVETLYSGYFTTPNAVEGRWQNNANGKQGEFSGTRIGGSSDAMYRFTANYISTAGAPDAGLFTFDINGTGTTLNVSGVAYSQVSDSQVALSGTLNTILSNSNLIATTANGVTITATADLAAGTLVGAGPTPWDNGAGNSGTITGNGCRLN